MDCDIRVESPSMKTLSNFAGLAWHTSFPIA